MGGSFGHGLISYTQEVEARGQALNVQLGFLID